MRLIALMLLLVFGLQGCMLLHDHDGGRGGRSGGHGDRHSDHDRDHDRRR